MKRIHKVKTAVIVKDTIPDEKIEIQKGRMTSGGRQLCADWSEAETAD